MRLKATNRFQCFVGVDQTGAATRAGTSAKKLSVAVLRQDRKKLRLEQHRISHFNRSSLSPLWSGSCSDSEVLIAADCVLGLPLESWPSEVNCPWDLFERAHRSKHYGREPAARFFEQFFQGQNSKEAPKRRVEHLSGSNSVFLTRPFQRNIQTGTYRMWKDLGADKKWLNLWPHDLMDWDDSIPTLLEVYPSLLWKRLFGLNSRQASILKSHIHKRFPFIEIAIEEHEALDENLADSIVACLAAFQGSLDGEFSLEVSSSVFEHLHLQQEGWILGVAFPSP